MGLPIVAGPVAIRIDKVVAHTVAVAVRPLAARIADTIAVVIDEGVCGLCDIA